MGKKGSACDSVERDRIEMSLNQPQSMKNYTEMGFKKIRTPEHLFKLIKDFWEKNKETRKDEGWFVGNTYTNHWDSPTKMVSVEDTSLRGGGSRLKQKIWDAAKETMEEWTGEELTQCSLYGIRVYPEGAILATHVDRLPLVSSAIINVAQDVDEPWPIEVYGHDGKATNVTKSIKRMTKTTTTVYHRTLFRDHRKNPIGERDIPMPNVPSNDRLRRARPALT